MVRSTDLVAAARRKESEKRAEGTFRLPDENAWRLLEQAGLAQEIGFVLRMAQLTVFDDLLSRLRPLKLTLSQFTVLRLISAQPALSQQRIGDALRIKKTNLVALISNLEERGLVARAIATGDRRAYALRLTVKGERCLEKAMLLLRDHVQLISELLEPGEKESLVTALLKISLNLYESRDEEVQSNLRRAKAGC